MTLLNTEAQNIEPIGKAQSEANLSQDKPDQNVSQEKIENTDQNKQTSKENDKPEDPNWRAFREGRKKDRAEKEAAERRAKEKEEEASALKAAMEAAFSNRGIISSQQNYGMNEQLEETEEQRIERKVNELLSKKEQQYRQEQEENERREYPKRLMKDFPDFTQVCSQENLDYLDFHYPEISRPLQRLGEGYDKWHDTYYAVKKLIPNHSTAKKEALRAEINSNKPKSMASTGPSPTGGIVKESWQETESRRQENWSRMQRIMKGV